MKISMIISPMWSCPELTWWELTLGIFPKLTEGWAEKVHHYFQNKSIYSNAYALWCMMGSTFSNSEWISPLVFWGCLTRAQGERKEYATAELCADSLPIIPRFFEIDAENSFLNSASKKSSREYSFPIQKMWKSPELVFFELLEMGILRGGKWMIMAANSWGGERGNWMEAKGPVRCSSR